MPRLFVALDLPPNVIVELTRIQPAASPGLRNAKPEQMHLTLHFIGEADVAPISEALSGVQGRRLSLSISGVGRFPPQGHPKVLWAGLVASSELVELHSAIGTALAGIGFPPESRAFAPHLTLARCDTRTPAGIVNDFLDVHANFALPAFSVSEFVLYSSVLAPDGPVYHRERAFPLTVIGG